MLAGLLGALLATLAPSGMRTPHASKAFAVPHTESWRLADSRGTTYLISLTPPLLMPGQQKPVGGYPVVYYLADDDIAGLMTDTARRIQIDRNGMTPALLVGIKRLSSVSRGNAEKCGGPYTSHGKARTANEVLGFIRDVLEPKLVMRFTLDRQNRTLFGEGGEGAVALHALLIGADFRTFAIAAPCLTPGHARLKRDLAEFAAAPARAGRSSRRLLLTTVIAADGDALSFHESRRPTPSAGELGQIARTIERADDRVKVHVTIFSSTEDFTVVPASLLHALMFSIGVDSREHDD